MPVRNPCVNVKWMTEYTSLGFRDIWVSDKNFRIRVIVYSLVFPYFSLPRDPCFPIPNSFHRVQLKLNLPLLPPDTRVAQVYSLGHSD